MEEGWDFWGAGWEEGVEIGGVWAGGEACRVWSVVRRREMRVGGEVERRWERVGGRVWIVRRAGMGGVVAAVVVEASLAGEEGRV